MRHSSADPKASAPVSDAKPDLLSLIPSAPGFEAALDERFTVSRLFQAEDETAFFAAVAPRIRAVFTIGSIGLTATRIERMPQLGIVSCYGVGYERVDVEACRERGIMVTHSPGANARSVAEMTIALLLDTARSVTRRDRAIRTNGGRSATFRERGQPVASLYDKTLGILGFGAIGQAVARRAAALEMKVAYHSRTPRPDTDAVWHASVLSLAAASDALVVCVPGGPATYHMVDGPVLAALGPRGILVNVSRGSVVDEPALIEALAASRLLGAGLDVYEGEPDIPDALLALENVVLSPHTAGLTHEANNAMAARTLANLDAFFAGAPIPDPVPELRRTR